jgi:hypothetical protein
LTMFGVLCLKMLIICFLIRRWIQDCGKSLNKVDDNMHKHRHLTRVVQLKIHPTLINILERMSRNDIPRIMFGLAHEAEKLRNYKSVRALC